MGMANPKRPAGDGADDGIGGEPPPVPSSRPNPEKARRRREAAGLFAALRPGDRRVLDQALNQRILAHLSGLVPGLLLGFHPLPDEPDITSALRQWLRAGGRLALPAWSGGQGMNFRLVTDLTRDLEPGKCGIRTPKASLTEADPGEAVAVLAPGRAFSETRQRLGRGAGCYDVLFSFRKLLKIGIAYDFQIFPALPADPWDISMDAILTPTRIIAQREG